jgi:hypothetical protein
MITSTHKLLVRCIIFVIVTSGQLQRHSAKCRHAVIRNVIEKPRGAIFTYVQESAPRPLVIFAIHAMLTYHWFIAALVVLNTETFNLLDKAFQHSLHRCAKSIHEKY